MAAKKRVDVAVALGPQLGGIVLLDPRTAKGRAWCKPRLASALRLADGRLAVEARYAWAILAAMRADKLRLDVADAPAK